ncbi:MAG: 3'(2'),5'-bisphosphate nucleotidase CysQ [Alphaproteobacteria bacterium]
MIDLGALLPEVCDIADRAGIAVMEVYARDFETVYKNDHSPVTDADIAAEAIITPALQALLPGVPVVAEEAASAGRIPTVGDRPFWLVDPLDGTKEFVNRNGEFTVNIGLIVDSRPVLGVVLAPAMGASYAGAEGQGASMRRDGGARAPIHVRHTPAAGLTVVASRRHGDPETIQRYLAGRPLADTRNAGSSVKFCLLASGEADLYPRFGPTMEWDTAAGHAVLNAAGGRVTTEDGAELRYAKPNFRNPNFIAWGGDTPAA